MSAQFFSRPLNCLSAAIAIITMALLVPIWSLVRFAIGSDLYSFTLLIPLVAVYLFSINRTKAETKDKPSWALAAVPGVLALCLLCGPVLNNWQTKSGFSEHQDWISASAMSWVLLVWCATLLCLGWRECRRQIFPILFLVLFVPLPSWMETALENFLQHASAEAAAVFFTLSGMTFHREGLVFQLPTISLEVAPECSGIHSSLVLFVTSLVAGFLFLKGPWNRTALTLFVIPLAILRNGFRVWVLGELCVEIDPSLIHSPIHHRGGPIFFLLSLVPFSLLLLYLWRTERKRAKPEAPEDPAPADTHSTHL